MRAVPRERFVPPDLAAPAYDDGALPIGHGQTISQPYIVASMTQALALPAWSAAHGGARPKVLDVGTGSGYQAAVLAEMGAQVVSIEREPELADACAPAARGAGLPREGDRRRRQRGRAGMTRRLPASSSAAASPEVPVPLVDQLVPDGRLVIPIGTRRAR